MTLRGAGRLARPAAAILPRAEGAQPLRAQVLQRRPMKL